MCGLVGVYSKKGKPASERVYQIYKNQASRGKQGYGYLAIEDGKLVSVQRAKTEDEIHRLLKQESASLILFHHRLPTSTKNTVGTTHPIFVSNDELEFDYYWAHNGVITNSDLLKKKHEGLGYVYTTEFKEHTVAYYNNGESETLDTNTSKFNDSESLAIELSRYMEQFTSRVATFGGAAFWGVKLVKGTDEVVEVYFGKNKGRDLNIIENKKVFGFSSESGSDLEDMKIYIWGLKDYTDLQEIDLIMDEAKPAERVYGYGTHHVEKEKDVTVMSAPEVDAYLGLKNAYYTRNEAFDSGVPFGEFTPSEVNGVTFYLPVKFLAIDSSSRPLFSKSSGVGNMIKNLLLPRTVDVINEPPEPIPDKAQEKLEELCMTYARKSKLMDSYKDLVDQDKMSQAQCDKMSAKIQEQCNELEDEMSSLGIKQEIVEETLDTAIQLQDYNSSYKQLDIDYSIEDNDLTPYRYS